MDAGLKKTLKSVTLELRHLLEGRYDSAGAWHPGDLEQRLAAIGVRRDRASVPAEELSHLSDEDRHTRKVVDAYLKLRDEAGVERSEAVGEFVRETAYTWANRLLALRCMEARELIDPVILQQEAYGGRSLEHHRLAQRQPELCAGEDDGLFAVLDKVFREQAQRLPMLFDPLSPGIALRSSPGAMKDCFGLLSLNADTLRKYRIRPKEDGDADACAEPSNLFVAPDALGWAYQYWNTEEKDRVFERLRTVKGAKIAGADIIPATQLYTEDYMVKFLVQNSLGATWMGMHPESKLCEIWEYYVKDADRAPVAKKPVSEVTFLDPACGSGHFLLEAFDLLYAMYQEEGESTEPHQICDAILTKNLFGIDIDPRAVQIAEVALWMKAAERALDYAGAATNLVAATATHFKGEAWYEFLASFEREPSVARVLRKFAETMEHIDELGSLARPAEDLRDIIKEEHAIWERQIREQHEANYLFPEMRRDALSGQLAFQEFSDEQFGHRLLNRARFALDGFTKQARQAGEFDDQMLASETLAGFRLLDLLSRQYDVVAANPPYMGSKNMGAVLKNYIERNFTPGKRDIYAAFILRNCGLATPGGRIAMVTQQSWMFLQSLQDLREGLLRDYSIEALSQHGRYAFAEITNAVVQPVLLVVRRLPPSNHGLFVSFRLAAPRASEEQAVLLRRAIQKSVNGISFLVNQRDFLNIPGSPLCYWLNPSLMALVTKGKQLGTIAKVRKGLDTASNERFVRLFWEIGCERSRWNLFPKGGGYQRWAGLNWYFVDWQFNGCRIKSFGRGTPRNEQHYGHAGLTYTEFGRGCLGVRALPKGAIFSTSSPGIFVDDDGLLPLAHAVMNCRLSSFYLRVFQANIQHLGEGYLPMIPLPTNHQECDLSWTQTCFEITQALIASNPVEFECDPRGIFARRCSRATLADEMKAAAILHSVEGYGEESILNAYELSSNDRQAIFDETGVPVSNYRVLADYVAVPTSDHDKLMLTCVAAMPRNHEASSQAKEPHPALLAMLRARFESGPGTVMSFDAEETEQEELKEDEDSLAGACMPLPPQTFVEELSQKLEIHPISVYWLVKEGIENDGWRCLPEERRLWGDRTTVGVLSLLGHRWPRQIEVGEAVPNWADADGIIPLTAVADESTLWERVQRQLAAEEMDAGDFAEVMGKPLEAWLATRFFEHHTKQFKKRPIAWQVQSGSFTARNTPAFACLVYYHKIDVDAVPKVRSQYVGPLRQRLETERRGITSVATKARSDRQEKRRMELEDAIAELQNFDATLGAVASTGFGPKAMLPTLRQFAIDDAILTLKACSLRRLSKLVAMSALRDWINAADRSGLHPDFGSWIDNAVCRLDHFCAQVGPKSLDQRKLTIDPTAMDLAQLIAPHAAKMASEVLKLVCGAWWQRFDQAVLAPLKQHVKELNAERKQCEETLKAQPEPSPTDAREVKARLKEVKADMNALDKQIKDKTARGRAIRALIECWQSDEPSGWGDWLAEQPLFDQVSSLDGRRPAPKTIAEFVAQESLYAPDINDGVRVNIAPVQKGGLLAADVLAAKDVDKAIADRAQWRSDERRWVREGKLPQPGWWPAEGVQPSQEQRSAISLPVKSRMPFGSPGQYPVFVLVAMLQRSGGTTTLTRLARAYSLLSIPESLANNAPQHLAAVARNWADTYVESPDIGFFREAVLDLVRRNRLDGHALRSGTASLLNNIERLTIEDWVAFDAQIALAVVDSMQSQHGQETLPDDLSGQVHALMAG